MTQSTRETERKYEVPDTGGFPTLAALAREGTGADGRNKTKGKGKGKAKADGKGGKGRKRAGNGSPGLSLVDGGAHDLDAVYYDTADLRLARSAATLRRRTGGPDAGWHLKLPLPGDDRDEIRAPLQDGVPERLRELALSRTRGARLQPVVRIRSRRSVRDLVDADGTVLAEVALDRVDADSLRPEGGHASWAELEVELAAGDGDAALLDRVENALGAEGFTRSGSASKLARALSDTAADASGASGVENAPRPASGPRRGTAGAELHAYLTEQVRALVDLDPAVRRGLPDSVHRMRVACRRLRSCLRSYRSFVDREITDPVRADLKWLGGELGAERDQEVLAGRLREGVDRLPGELVLGPVSARLQAWDVTKSAEARERSLAALSSPRYVALLEALDRIVAAPPLTAGASRGAAKALPAALGKEFDRLGDRVDRALGTPAGPERDAALHEARKKAKRLRYAAEAAGPALGKPAKRLSKSVKSVQKALGDHHDGVVARDALRRHAVAAHAAGEPGFTWGLLYGREQAAADAREESLPKLWRAAARARPRKS
ncbi:CYTH and CHAD domain-containing protein [Streptomyces sp. NPDC006172]|uniref:CYTH and CHAD domain-containing protein n=1 Tax=Streptomyces sp. NPDC006172 TaxID=3154470 RepID=UPI0033DB4979